MFKNPLWPLLVALAMVVIFLHWPRLDLAVTGWFYHPGEGFYLGNRLWVRTLYWAFAHLHLLIVPLLLGWLIWAGWQRHGIRKPLYLLLVLLLGPGLIVNGILKAESGRARPHQIQIFGGVQNYSAPFHHADQCQENCSFVSGHAAMGFWFLTLGWASGRRRWFWFGVGLGALVGLGRILQGGHFFSDVLFSFWVVYLVAWGLSATLIKRA